MAAHKKYPGFFDAECAYCKKKGRRLLVHMYSKKSLWFCCPEHKVLRKEAIKAGEMKCERKKPSVSAPNVKKSTGRPRRTIESVTGPSEYERKYL